MPFPHKNIRLRTDSYLGQRGYFVTICCAHRRAVFAETAIAKQVLEILAKHAATHQFAVYAYCVMPDHFHMLASGMQPSSDLLAFVKNFKQTTSSEYSQQYKEPLWQKKFYDHILRPGDNADAVAGYIWMNPVRKGLRVSPQEYPHSGSLVIDWKKAFLPSQSWTPLWKTNPAHKMR